MAKKNKKKTNVTLLFWVICFVALGIVFLFSWTKIKSNLKETAFFDRVFGKTPAFIENADIKPNKEKNEVLPEGESSLEIDLGTGNSSADSSDNSDNVLAKNNVTRQMEKEAEEVKSRSEEEAKKPLEAKETPKKETQKKENVSSAETKTAEEQVKSIPATMKLKLFFIDILADGSFTRHEVARVMKKSDSPLMDSIRAIIAGPNADEEKSGCKTFVNPSTRLLGASVKDGVATLNFSESFESNQYGVEGLIVQLQQVVFTATAFPTVNSVQIIIEGEKKDYLGEEGVWIGSPLNRNSFRN